VAFSCDRRASDDVLGALLLFSADPSTSCVRRCAAPSPERTAGRAARRRRFDARPMEAGAEAQIPDDRNPARFASGVAINAELSASLSAPIARVSHTRDRAQAPEDSFMASKNGGTTRRQFRAGGPAPKSRRSSMFWRNM